MLTVDELPLLKRGYVDVARWPQHPLGAGTKLLLSQVAVRWAVARVTKGSG